MRTIKGPAIFLAQFAGDAAPFNSLGAMARWAGDLGYVGVQIPTWDSRLIDLAKDREAQEGFREHLHLPRATRYLSRYERGLIAFLEEGTSAPRAKAA